MGLGSGRSLPRMPKPTVTRIYVGHAEAPVPWEVLERIFDALWGADAHGLPSYPQVIGAIHASWMDASGIEHSAEHLDEVRAAYERYETLLVTFSGYGENRPYSEFHYWPGRNATVRAEMRAEDEATASAYVKAIRNEFPLVTRSVFVSYATSDYELAMTISDLLSARLDPGILVFVAKRDIEPGGNPLKRMLEEELLRADALLALCSKASATSPWLWWESAAVWARSGLVVPLFVDVTPSEFVGPMTLVLQGRKVFDAGDLNAALEAVVRRTSTRAYIPISDEEMARLARLR